MINSEFSNLLVDPTIQFTIILGSGFHRQGLGEHSILSNWSALLSRLTHSEKITGNFTLDFERIVIAECKKDFDGSTKMAHEIEKKLLSKLAKMLQSEQKYVRDNLDSFSYPNLFSGNKISDVVSLNFDTLAEDICSVQSPNFNLQNGSTFNKLKSNNNLSDSFETQITSYQEHVNRNKQKIRFWHPHGLINNSKHMVLGISNYSKLVSLLDAIRKSYKANEDYNSPNNELTWFSSIVQNPVLILGASMSQMEWAMWTAFVYKFRNFAKPKNEQYCYPIFQMVEQNHDKQLKNDWFQPLFTRLTFDEQWKELEKLFGGNKLK